MIKKAFLSFGKGILAGLCIGLGGFLYVLMTFVLPNEGGKTLGSILFAMGLFLVCTLYLDLYTGKIGLIYEKKKQSYYINLPIMLIGNAVGAIGLGYLCYFIFRDTGVMDSVSKACSSRLGLDDFLSYLELCMRSFLCGFCVYMAVKLFAKDRLRPLDLRIGILRLPLCLLWLPALRRQHVLFRIRQHLRESIDLR